MNFAFGILLTLDQEKASDRVDHDFLRRVLVPPFTDESRSFILAFFSRRICNDHLSAPVHLGRGVRQGCPLSLLLYVLTLEVLSTQICKCSNIEGFLLPVAGGLQFKVSQYADDVTNFVKKKISLPPSTCC